MACTTSPKPRPLMRRSERQKRHRHRLKSTGKDWGSFLMRITLLHYLSFTLWFLRSSSVSPPSPLVSFLSPLVFLFFILQPHTSSLSWFSLFPELAHSFTSLCLPTILWIFVKCGASVEELTQPDASWALHGTI